MPTNKFHYIWMGNVPTGKYEDTFKQGPNALAGQLKEFVMDKKRVSTGPNPQDQEIIMWVPKAIITDIKNHKLLDPEITLKPVEDLYENANHLTKEERENLKTTVNLLGENRAYASQKDILSAAVLEEYGGYYFDTNTKIDSIEKLVSDQPKDVWFPRISEFSGRHYDGHLVIVPEVWALYNPQQGGGTFKAMVNSYVQRCQYYFPEKFTNARIDDSKVKIPNGDFKSGYNFSGSGSRILSSATSRDVWIGETVVYSLLDGLQQTKGPLTENRMRSLSSLTKSTKEGEEIAEKGIHKTHAGTWRKLAKKVEQPRVEAANNASSQKTEANVSQPTPTQNHSHMFELEASSFKDLKTKYQALKGDKLKHQILSDFKNKLAEVSDKESLDHFVNDFKQSESYNVLATGQGLATKMLFFNTTSQNTVEEIIKDRIEEIDQTPNSTLG